MTNKAHSSDPNHSCLGCGMAEKAGLLAKEEQARKQKISRTTRYRFLSGIAGVLAAGLVLAKLTKPSDISTSPRPTLSP